MRRLLKKTLKRELKMVCATNNTVSRRDKSASLKARELVIPYISVLMQLKRCVLIKARQTGMT